MAVRRRAPSLHFETVAVPDLLERLKQNRSDGARNERRNTEKGSGDGHGRDRKRILSLSYDVALLDSRRMLLEEHGYQVTSVIGLEAALVACKQTVFDLVILGHSIPAEHKRRMLEQVRAVCDTPVLTLQRNGERPQDADHVFSPIEGPRAFLAAVDGILRRD